MLRGQVSTWPPNSRRCCRETQLSRVRPCAQRVRQAPLAAPHTGGAECSGFETVFVRIVRSCARNVREALHHAGARAVVLAAPAPALRGCHTQSKPPRRVVHLSRPAGETVQLLRIAVQKFAPVLCRRGSPYFSAVDLVLLCKAGNHTLDFNARDKTRTKHYTGTVAPLGIQTNICATNGQSKCACDRVAMPLAMPVACCCQQAIPQFVPTLVAARGDSTKSRNRCVTPTPTTWWKMPGLRACVLSQGSRSKRTPYSWTIWRRRGVAAQLSQPVEPALGFAAEIVHRRYSCLQARHILQERRQPDSGIIDNIKWNPLDRKNVNFVPQRVECLFSG